MSLKIRDSPYYVFVALCIVVIVVSLIKIAASNGNIECFREYFAVDIAHLTPKKLLHESGQKISHL
jgi:SNF family Na+-dependent transporter